MIHGSWFIKCTLQEKINLDTKNYVIKIKKTIIKSDKYRLETILENNQNLNC